MALDLSVFRNDLRGMIADIPAKLRLTQNGKEIDCALDDLSGGLELMDAVENRRRTVNVTAPLADFPEPPEEEQLVSVQFPGSDEWIDFFIQSLTTSQDNEGVSMVLRANRDT